MIAQPASMTHDSVPKEVRLKRQLTDSLVRLSDGIEEIDDIIADLAEGLATGLGTSRRSKA